MKTNWPMRQLCHETGKYLKNFKSTNKIVPFVSCFIVLLNLSKSLSKVRYFDIKEICRPMRKIQLETGESLEFFKPLIKLYLLYLFLYSLT